MKKIFINEKEQPGFVNIVLNDETNLDWKRIVNDLECNAYENDINICGNVSVETKTTLVWFITKWVYYNCKFELNISSDIKPVKYVSEKLREASAELHKYDW